MKTQARYRLHAKQIGWGWSFPATWQGWPGLASGNFAAGCRKLPARFGSFLLAIGTLPLPLVGIRFIEGEPLHD